MRLSRVVSVFGATLLACYALLIVAGVTILGPSGQSLVYLTLFFVCLSMAWNLFSGFSGYINFGFAVFVGIGMYVAVIAIVDLKFGLWTSYLLGGVAAGGFAALTGYPLLQIRGAYFSIAMLAIAEGARILVGTEYLDPYTRGGRGFPVLAGTLTEKYFAMLALAIVTFMVCAIVARTRFGLSLIAIREDEDAADGLGVNTTVVKVAAFVLSGFFAGMAGGIHATFVHYIDPNSAFDIKFTIMPLIMALFGSLGTVVGPVIGGVVLEIISDFSWLYLGRMNITIFGLILIGLVLWLPEGVIVRLKEAGILPKTRTV
jgi:branched-chain amino acid transport system permease protein